MKKILWMFPYLCVHVVLFYLLPLMIQNTGMAMLMMLIVIPVLCLSTAVIYGIKNKLQWLYPLLVALLFVPSVFIFYNHTAWSYAIAYGFIALVGCLIGQLFHKRTKVSK